MQSEDQARSHEGLLGNKLGGQPVGEQLHDEPHDEHRDKNPDTVSDELPLAARQPSHLEEEVHPKDSEQPESQDPKLQKTLQHVGVGIDQLFLFGDEGLDAEEIVWAPRLHISPALSKRKRLDASRPQPFPELGSSSRDLI